MIEPSLSSDAKPGLTEVMAAMLVHVFAEHSALIGISTIFGWLLLGLLGTLEPIDLLALPLWIILLQWIIHVVVFYAAYKEMEP